MTTTTRTLIPADVDALNPGWTAAVTPWEHGRDDAWRRTFMGKHAGADARQTQTYGPGNLPSRFGSVKITKPGVNCPSWCSEHYIDDAGQLTAHVHAIAAGHPRNGGSVLVELRQEPDQEPTVSVSVTGDGLTGEEVHRLAAGLEVAVDLLAQG